MKRTLNATAVVLALIAPGQLAIAAPNSPAPIPNPESSFRSNVAPKPDPTTPQPVPLLPVQKPTADVGKAAESACALDKTVEDGAAAADRRVKEFVEPRAYQLGSEKDRAQQARNHLAEGDRFQLEAGIKRHDFSLDHVPQTTVRWEEKEFRFGIPVPGQCQIGKTKVPEWHGIWHMEWVMHPILVPCAKTKEVTLNIRVPKVEVWVGPTRGALGIPEIRQKDFKDELDDAEKQISRLDVELQTGPERVRREEIARTKDKVRRQIADYRTRALGQIAQAEAAGVGPIEKQRADLVTNAEAARQQFAQAGGDPTEIDRAFTPGIAALDEALAAVRREFVGRRTTVEAEFTQLEAKYLGGAGDNRVPVPVCPTEHRG